MNSCEFTLEALNAGPPYEGTLGVACDEAGDAIESIAKFSGNPICTTKLGPQPGAGAVARSNSGEGSEEEAEQPRLAAESYPLAIEAFGEGETDVLANVQGGGWRCGEAAYEAELTAASDELDLQAEYADCYGENEAEEEFPAQVQMNSCRYVLRLANAGPPYEGTVDVACAEPGDAIELKTYLYGTPENPNTLICKGTVGPQQGLGEVSP